MWLVGDGRCCGGSVESTRALLCDCMDGWLRVDRAMSTVEHNYVTIDCEGGVAMRSKAVVNCRLVSFKEISGSERKFTLAILI